MKRSELKQIIKEEITKVLNKENSPSKNKGVFISPYIIQVKYPTSGEWERFTFGLSDTSLDTKEQAEEYVKFLGGNDKDKQFRVIENPKLKK